MIICSSMYHILQCIYKLWNWKYKNNHRSENVFMCALEYSFLSYAAWLYMLLEWKKNREENSAHISNKNLRKVWHDNSNTTWHDFSSPCRSRIWIARYAKGDVTWCIVLKSSQKFIIIYDGINQWSHFNTENGGNGV